MLARAILFVSITLSLFGILSAPEFTSHSQTPERAAQKNESMKRPASQEKATGFTNEELKRARPMPLPVVDPEKVRAAVKTRERRGAPGAIEAVDSTKRPTQEYSGNINSTPLHWAGRLFFKQDGEGWVCSAQFISPTVLLTAAHCARNADTGDWSTNLVFYLQYKEGSFTERYDYKCVGTKQGWVTAGNDGKWIYDFALILVDHESITGHFGARWNWEGIEQLNKIGYPGGMFDGEILQVEQGPISVSNGIVAIQHGNTAEQGGSSGGAWIADFKYGSTASGANQIASIESFGIPALPGVDFGPYLTDDFKELWDYVERGCEDEDQGKK
ncbi:MAG TPA: hypothetical protein VKT73_16695 [Xanthobacteraceae bacterium]|nr:hypothetical protein [Xanthobacteraceae bacterium]